MTFMSGDNTVRSLVTQTWDQEPCLHDTKSLHSALFLTTTGLFKKDHRKKCNGLYLYFDAFFCFLYFDAVAVVLDRRFSFDFLNIHPCTMHACA